MTLVVAPPSTATHASFDTGFGGWLAFDPAEYAIAMLGHLAVSAAGGEGRPGRLASLARPFTQSLLTAGVEDTELSQFLASLARRDGKWRAILGDGCRGMAEDRLMLVAIELSTYSRIPPVTDDPLACLRRLDAVLDILDVPAAAAVVQEHYILTVEDLLSAGAGGFDVAGAARRARPFAEALSFFHPVVGMAASFGLNRLDAHEDDAPAPEPPAGICELARTVTAVQAAFVGIEQSEHAVRISSELLTQIGDDHIHSAAYAAAVTILSEIDGVSRPEPDRVPDMTGRALRDARQMMTNLGLACDAVDEVCPFGTPRLVLSDANWTVASQTRPVAGRVTLGVRKRTDPRR